MFNFITDLSSTYIRPLTANDSAGYRALRQRVLDSGDGRYFSDSYERERQLTESQWLEWCAETPAHCILGTFTDNALVGVIMVTRQGSVDSPIVEWEAAWLDPRYRGVGLGRPLYEQARQWSQKQGYKYVAGFIRTDNTPSLNLCKSIGFVYAYTLYSEIWADGSIADTHAFLLDLRATAATTQPVYERFAEAFPFLNQGLHAPTRQDDSVAA